MITPRNDGPLHPGRYIAHPLHPSDCTLFALEMRDADVRETVAVLGVPVKHALEMMIARVPEITSIYAFREEQLTPLALYGLMPISDYSACPFMLGCRALDDHPLALQRHTRVILTGWKSRYLHLFNWVHAENTAATRWLEGLGFRMRDPAPYGARGELFRRFDWVRLH